MPSLTSLRRHPLVLLPAALCAGMLATGCAANERLVMKDSSFTGEQVRMIDLMPVDFWVHLDDVGQVDEEERRQVNQEVSAAIEQWTRRFLRARGYELGNAITWQNGATGAHGQVSGEQIQNLALDILDFVNSRGIPAGTGEHEMYVYPEVLQQLSAATGSDAVLYVNGKASVETEAKKAQKAFVAICCVVLAVIFLYLLHAESKSSSSSKVSSSRVRTPPRARAVPRHVHRGRVYGPMVRVGLYTPLFIHIGPRGYSSDRYVVEQEGDDDLQGDRLWLSFTLVSTEDGEVLWHSKRVVDVSATDDQLLRETMQELMREFLRAAPPEVGPGAAPEGEPAGLPPAAAEREPEAGGGSADASRPAAAAPAAAAR